MRIEGATAEQIMERFLDYHSELPDVLGRTRELVRRSKREIYEYQAALLYVLARPLDGPKAHVLEIGTAYGYSCAVLAQACREAQIVTLNPKGGEYEEAVKILGRFPKVTVLRQLSWDYLGEYKGPLLNLVFVDGDHPRIARDLPWYGKLRVGGLFLCHDYSPAGSRRPCPPVYDVLNKARGRLGRDFDVLVVDDGRAGMAGWYRKDGEKLEGGQHGR